MNPCQQCGKLTHNRGFTIHTVGPYYLCSLDCVNAFVERLVAPLFKLDFGPARGQPDSEFLKACGIAPL